MRKRPLLEAAELQMRRVVLLSVKKLEADVACIAIRGTAHIRAWRIPSSGN